MSTAHVTRSVQTDGATAPGVPRNSVALARKLRYALSRYVLIDSFGPVKRLLDVVFAFTLLVVTSPFTICWLCLRGIGGKPVFTRTQRLGRLGLKFLQYGFAGLERHPVLRNLPALVNVLLGELSFIGPRPAAPGDPVLQTDARARLTVKPGLICSWWLRKRANIDFDNEAASDREYLNTASIAGDLGIALRVIPALAFSEKRGAAPDTVDVLGLRIDNLSMAEALDWIRQRLAGEGQSVVCMTNAHCANVSCLNATYHQTLIDAGLNLADGIGIRLAGKLKGTPIRQNVNGTDLFPRLCAMLDGANQSIYLLGGRPGVPEGVAEWIRQRYPGTVIAGLRNGYIEQGEEGAVTAAIKASGATLLLVAMGVPQQELWIRRHLKDTGVRVAVGVGGLFDFYSGRIPRAPAWMREVGLEWSYRLLQEPGRMWKRYLIGNWTFLGRFLLYELNLYRPHRHLKEVIREGNIISSEGQRRGLL